MGPPPDNSLSGNSVGKLDFFSPTSFPAWTIWFLCLIRESLSAASALPSHPRAFYINPSIPSFLVTRLLFTILFSIFPQLVLFPSPVLLVSIAAPKISIFFPPKLGDLHGLCRILREVFLLKPKQTSDLHPHYMRCSLLPSSSECPAEAGTFQSKENASARVRLSPFPLQPLTQLSQPLTVACSSLPPPLRVRKELFLNPQGRSLSFLSPAK